MKSLYGMPPREDRCWPLFTVATITRNSSGNTNVKIPRPRLRQYARCS